MAIYHWKLGDVALARLCKKVYAKVKVIKNENGLFYEQMVLGISSSTEDTVEVKKELCYYVETIRTGQRMWLPYTCMHLAERGRPFYGINKLSPTKPATPAVHKKRKIKEEYPLPLSVKLHKQKEPDLNVTYDSRHAPLKQGRYENAFSEFIRRGKEMVFDQFYFMLEEDKENNYDTLDYLKNVDASTEDKFEMALKNMVTEKEVENYLHQCWRFNFVHRQSMHPDKDREGSDNSKSSSPTKPAVTIHISWCLVCGKQEGRLRECLACPAAFHLACRREWLVTIIPMKMWCGINLARARGGQRGCCRPGPRPPVCCLAHTHHDTNRSGTLNYSWGEPSRMCLFLPSHTSVLGTSRDPTLQQAVLDACDDYIAVYLT